MPSYYKLDVKEIDLSQSNLIEVWSEYCKISAFQKTYTLFLKKKIDKKKILIFAIIFSLNIPFKILKIAYFFIITNKKNFRKGLEILYTEELNKSINRKIEILNEKIYLNCFTVGKLIKKSKIYNFDEQAIFNYLHDLKLESINIKNFEEKKKEYSELRAAKITTNENKVIKIPHFTYLEKSNTIHATSKNPIDLEKSQKIFPPMVSLQNKEMIDPKTIVSEKTLKTEWGVKTKWIPTYEINAIKYKNLHMFDLKINEINYHYQKKITHEELIKSHFGENFKIEEEVINELVQNCYLNEMAEIKNKDIIEIIKEIKDIR